MKLTADQLVEKGLAMWKSGQKVIFLLPSQEWLAVEAQTPFLRQEKMPTDGDGKITYR